MITDYGSLKNDITLWANRPDLLSNADLFVQLCASDIKTFIKSRINETFSEILLANGSANLPNDFVEFKWLKSLTPKGGTLEAKPSEYIQELISMSSLNGAAKYYALDMNKIYVYPYANSISAVFYKSFPNFLANNDTNPLLLSEPNLYLFGSLRYLYNFVENAELEQKFERLFMEQVSKINSANVSSLISGGPLRQSLR